MNKSRNPRILFYVQHLLGVGHVFRAQRLTEGFAADGMPVDIVYGGEPVGDMEFAAKTTFCLPPVKAADIGFSSAVTGTGEPLTDAYMADRQQKLLAHFETLEPDAILIEAWPFGRRPFRHELTALVEAARSRQPRPLIVCSVRDILHERRKPGRLEETVSTLNRLFDLVVVHSDPSLIRLDATFPLCSEIAPDIEYTGFVTASPETQRPAAVEQFDIVCSIGGGAFGAPLLQSALATARMPGMAKYQWCLSTGPNLPQDVRLELQRDVPPHVTVRSFLDGLEDHLAEARLSISQCGYNTAMDVLAAQNRSGTRAVFVPSDVAGQTEQLRRAELLAEAGRAVCLPESRLSPKTLHEAVTAAFAMEPARTKIDFHGVQNTVQILRERLAARRS